jgi:hypothetical protein
MERQFLRIKTGRNRVKIIIGLSISRQRNKFRYFISRGRSEITESVRRFRRGITVSRNDSSEISFRKLTGIKILNLVRGGSGKNVR